MSETRACKKYCKSEMSPKRVAPIAIRGKKIGSQNAKAKARTPVAASRKYPAPTPEKKTPPAASASAPTPGRAAGGRAIVAVLMQLQTDVKVRHFQTHSFAAHKALDELHAVLIEKIDAFVEQYMGTYGRVDFGARGIAIKLRNVGKRGLVGALRSTASFLTKSLPGSISANDTDLLTLRDDILGAIRKTQYLLSFK